MLLVSPGQVLRREGAEEGEFPGEDAGGHDLRKRLCVGSRRVPAPGDAEHRETLMLGIDPRAAADRPDRKRRERDRDVDAAFHPDRKSTRLNSSHRTRNLESRIPSYA
jgi:hypothetical protein